MTSRFPAATNTSDKKTGSENALPSPASARCNKRQEFRFEACDRLPDSAAYSCVFAGATRSRDRYFTVLSRENGQDHARLGLAISKKHCRRATARNRLKRLVRESFRYHKAALAGLDLVVLGQPAAGDADNKTLFDSLAGHWQRSRSRKP
ncbi:MAG: ribonuclease P protein component [Woeseia sp.]